MTDTSRKPERHDPGYTQADWDAVSDNPELTDDELAGLRPAHEVQEIFALLPKRVQERPRRADAKVSLTLRVNPELLEAYKAGGPGWQVRMHDALSAGAARPVAGSDGENPASGPSEPLSSSAGSRR